jgi:hypothetical protein
MESAHTISNRPAVVLEAHNESLQESMDMGPHRVCRDLGTQLSDTRTRSLTHSMVVRLTLSDVELHLLGTKVMVDIVKVKIFS